MKKRVAIRWWKSKSQWWLFGPKHVPGQYVKLNLGPLEIVLRSRKRANFILGKPQK